MKKLAVLVGVVAVLTWGTGAWAALTQDTMSAWSYSQDNLSLGGSFSGLNVAFTDLSNGNVELDITSSLSNSALFWSGFIFTFVSATGNGVLQVASSSSPVSINSVSVNGTWPLTGPTFPWPPGGGGGLGIGTANVKIAPTSGTDLLAYNGALSIVLTSNVSLTSSDFNNNFETSGGGFQSPARYFGAILSETGQTKQDGVVAGTSTVAPVPVPPSFLLLAGGLGGLGFLRRKRTKA